MAKFRGENNAKGFTVPTELIKKNEKTGEVQFAVDRITLPTGITDGDVVLMQEIPANAKVLRVKFLTGSLATGDIDVGYSSSSEEGLNDKDALVTADPDAFIASADPVGVDEVDMAVGAAGYLVERERATFLTLTMNTTPVGAAGTDVSVIMEYVSK